jgi:hypothetical protein
VGERVGHVTSPMKGLQYFMRKKYMVTSALCTISNFFPGSVDHENSLSWN